MQNDGQLLTGVAPEAGVGKPDPILVATDVRKAFGGIQAVDLDHLEVQRGGITALIGPNGAGKSTFFNCLTGFEPPDSGRWHFEGQPLQRLPAHKVARAGMIRTFQLTKALSKLSVLDNMLLAAPNQKGEHFLASLYPGSWRKQEQHNRGLAEALLERFGIAHMRDEYAGTMSGGQRKLMEMARALMAEPRMIMLDEPMSGVNPALVQSLLGHMRELRDEGLTVVFVEHDMDVVMDISDWVVCLADGRVIAEGSPDDISRNPAVIDAYLGAAHGDVTADEKPQGANAPDGEGGAPGANGEDGSDPDHGESTA
ncbi:ABC transporter ATP-binding protein [Egibacter rhizosphaerae]|uniref:ABC transporter ATP-binding protein n=1 Tax=Egibacter rhizosphaerae TaxID=1670831 RepID=A0A411YKT8_9ACTN|nr:ABC transporter ATP-binding protein [Egibacter rhizosphaerae]QBI21790.1 ABC transporter ATP-binding protein [Egibacter rhizosphaerae]